MLGLVAPSVASSDSYHAESLVCLDCSVNEHRPIVAPFLYQTQSLVEAHTAI